MENKKYLPVRNHVLKTTPEKPSKAFSSEMTESQKGSSGDRSLV
ncbi:hypothetical protein LptCag_1795 [Leptospirillum ferriphilum]|uniref:Uncharacterized protein n=1 Tax=Leptospirillum ferriphilum TaxID=178606 RepID=A0A094W9D6_9BACT|nr:hypothetical protein LptCag_1795 [Leptospirillum ferriphilum]